MKVVGKQHTKTYTLKKALGKGAYGTVYECGPFAVKEIDTGNMSTALKKYAESELKIMKMCNH